MHRTGCTSMRLTKYHKESIIAAIMQDVPKPARDFDEEHRP